LAPSNAFAPSTPRSTCYEGQLIETDGADDYLHLLVEHPPKVGVPNLVNSLKGVSSRLLRKEWPEIQRR
jgi:putative transposase